MTDYDAYFARRDRAAAGAGILAARDPERAATANRLAAQLQMPAEVVEGDIATYQAQVRAQQARRVLDSSTALTAWASNPRNAAVAADDVEALGKNAEYWKRAASGTLKPVEQPEGTFWNSIKGIATTAAESFARLPTDIQRIGADWLPSFDLSAPGTPRLKDASDENARRISARSDARVDAATPRFQSRLARYTYQGGSSLVQMLPSVAAGAVGGLPAALSVAAAQTGLPAYSKYRDRGGTRGEAALGGALEGGIEAGTELIPMGFLVNRLGKVGAREFVSGFLGRELPSEIAATLGQNAVDTAIANPNKTWGEYLREQPDEIAATAVGTLMAGGFFAGVNHAGRRFAQGQERADQGTSAGDALDAAMGAAAQAKTRDRDKPAFQSLLASLTTDTPIEKLFVPAEAVERYFQSHDISDDEAGFWGKYRDQIAEALATGGDVVLDTADAATHLAGSPAWEALRPDVRTSAGGMSPAEAAAWEQSHADSMEQVGGRIAEEMAAARDAAEPFQRVYRQIRDQLTNAGYTQSAADLNAMIFAQRAATRAERLGRPLVGDEANGVQIRNILPPGLAPIVAADPERTALKATIARMRSARGGKVDLGPSLLDWIAQRGGIEDQGGDIASMGGDRWHREKAFRRRLIKPSAAAGQGDMLGVRDATANSPERLFAAAIDAGYFPEMVGRETDDTGYDAKADVADFMSAIEAELRGTPRHVEQANDGRDQAVADELAQLLEQAGLDPASATESEIVGAIDAYRQEQREGQRYYQFAGLSALTASWEDVERAIAMERQGDAPAEIEEATGWRRGPDGQWRWEIDDSGAKLKDWDGLKAGHVTWLGNILDHPALYEAYPSLRDVPVRIVEGAGGSWTGHGITIGDRWIGRHETRENVGIVLHEVQHAIQDIEGFARGAPSSPDGLRARGYGSALDEEIARLRQQGEQADTGWGSAGGLEEGQLSRAAARNVYYRSAGEIEARNTQARRNMTQAQRREDSALWTQDRSNDQAIVSFMQSQPSDVVATLTGNELGPVERETVVERTRAYYRDNLQGTTITRDGFGEVRFSGKGWQKLKAGLKVDLDRARLLPALPAIIRDGQYDGVTDLAKDRTDGMVRFHHFSARVALDGVTHDVGVTVGEDAFGRLFYNLNRNPRDLLEKAERRRSDRGIEALGPSPLGGEGSTLKQDIADGGDGFNLTVNQDGQQPRGQIRFEDSGAIIDLFQSRDASTFLHEAGHLWLTELQADSAQGEALAADWETVKAWFAANGHPVGDDGTIPVEAHELWARGIERYAMEGKSPSSTLRRVFDAFRGWMLNIYEVVARLRSPITPEIRGVMDRLIATDAEIAEAREREHLSALFTDAAQAGMTDDEFAAYNEAVNGSRDEAHDALLYRTMEAIRRQRTAAWKDEERGVRADVTEAVNRRPEFRALHLLRTGRMLGDPEAPATRMKLDKAWLIERYGDGILSVLPKGVPPIYAETETSSADAIAELAGFTSGDEMVRTLVTIEERTREMRAANDKRSVRQAMIDAETDAQMRERHGDILSDGSIEEEALAAVHNDRAGEVMASELRSLGRRVGEQPTPYQIAREWAARKIAESTVADATSGAAIQRYTRAAAKAGQEAEAALLKQDIGAAFRAKQSQMLNNALIREASRARDDVAKARDRLAAFAKRRTMKSMDQDYLEQIHELLEQVEFRQRTQRSVERQASFEEWARAREAEGHDIVVPSSFAASFGTTHWSRLPVEKLLGLDETVAQIAHLGRFKQKLLDAQDERDFDAVVDEAVAAAEALPQRPPSNLMTPDWRERIKAGVASADAALLKMETVFDWLDGGNATGVFNRVVFKPIAEAQARENGMVRDYIKRLTDSLMKVGRKTIRDWDDTVQVTEMLNRETGQPWVLKRQQLVSIALNMGNAGNIQRLTDGYGWSEAGVRAALDRILTQQEWTYVQEVWDTLETLWPEIAAMERRVNGVAPDKVDATPVPTPYGPLRGGYFPAIYDTAKSYRAEKHSGAAADLLETTYTKASTRAGSTRDRVEQVDRAILLDLGVINRHVTEVIHDVTHREVLMQADRFLSSERVMRAVDASLGREVRQSFRPWLKHIANQWATERAGNEGIAKWIKKARTNTTAVGMGLRASTVIMQASGYANSFEVVGERWVAPEMARFATQLASAPVKGVPAMYTFAMERSSELRDRMDTLDRDIQSGIRQLQGGIGAVTDAKRFFFHGIGYADRIVSVPTWMGAYNKALAANATEDEAVYAADKAIRVSQGAGAAKDLAAVQRGTGTSGEALKLLTMFYSFFSAQYQRQRTLARDARSAVREGDYRATPRLIARAWWLLVVPPLLSELLAGRGPDDDEDWGEWASSLLLFNLFGSIPIVRDIVRPAYEKLMGDKTFGYAISPVQRAGDTIVATAGDVGKVARGEDTKRATRDTLEAVGYTTGLVPGQIATATQFLVDVGYGEQDPQGVAEWWNGLTTGKARREK